MDCDEVVFSGHAVRRMFEREFAVADVVAAIRAGEIIESYPDDEPLPSYLLLGFIGEEPLHVVVAVDAEANRCVTITLYRPAPELWGRDFQTRRG